MRAAVDVSGPAVASGLLGFWDGNRLSDKLRSYRRIGEARQAQAEGSLFALSGANMATQFHDKVLLEEILALPHMWPGEARAMAARVLDYGGTFRYVIQPEARVLTSARFYPSLTARVLLGAQGAIRQRVKGYESRVPTGVTHYFDGTTIRPRPHSTAPQKIN